MSASFWKNTAYTGQPPQIPASVAAPLGKRPRTEDELAGSHDLSAHYGYRGIAGGGRDHYMNHVMPTYGPKESRMSISGGFTGHPTEDLHLSGIGGFGTQAVSAQNLPADASGTLFVEGLPADCTKREVSHVFRPFNGFKEVRLVIKEPRKPGGAPLVLCFVDFVSPAHATTALYALQGYQFDEANHTSGILKLQYARFTAARSGGERRGRP